MPTPDEPAATPHPEEDGGHGPVAAAALPLGSPSVELVPLPDGPRLAVRRFLGPARPYLLVHGLASNARLWDGVGSRLAAAGHEVAAVDLRGHGRSEAPAGGYDTPTAAADLARLVHELGWVGPRAPIVAGQSWGGNVALHLATSAAGVAGLALVDGGWIFLAGRFPTFEACWEVLAPPDFTGVAYPELMARLREWTAGWPAEAVEAAAANFRVLPDGTVQARLARDAHRSILLSLWQDDPRLLYPLVRVPTLLLAAGDSPDPAAKRAAVEQALAGLPQAQLRWYPDAHHDLHAQLPAETAADLLSLAARASGTGS